MAQASKKCRQYSSEYLRFGFAVIPGTEQLPVCLLCERVFSNETMKPSRMKRHLKRRHPNMSNKEVSHYRALREKVMKKRTPNSKADRDGLAASYRISMLIAKAGKPHTIGEKLMMPAIAEVLETVLQQNAHDVTRKISLSNVTVQRRIDAMTKNTEETLWCMLREREFSLQLDESTLPGNESLLVAYA
ncbi:zf-BED domain containing protein [Trichuris trichiura]|uniref:Zf-BED domain containing protein n=1 Tax=Trichuris trichiura TaxID=36087 RepID=A0A077Z2F9_TRITR|nr:zf-BED domain containing protein [Trichuris trichiura]